MPETVLIRVQMNLKNVAKAGAQTRHLTGECISHLATKNLRSVIINVGLQRLLIIA